LIGRNQVFAPRSPDIHVNATTREALEDERKTVTALFGDIKGSTELMRDLDPEEARTIVDPVLHLMMESVHRYGGYVAQSTGDGIFALFSAPVAHEDRRVFVGSARSEGHGELALQGSGRRVAVFLSSLEWLGTLQ
jgi:class 3 adenylate cyclase